MESESDCDDSMSDCADASESMECTETVSPPPPSGVRKKGAETEGEGESDQVRKEKKKSDTRKNTDQKPHK